MKTIKENSRLLTPTERLKWLSNQAYSKFNFGTIHTLQDFLCLKGHSVGELQYAYEDLLQQLQQPLTREKIKHLLDIERCHIEQDERIAKYENTTKPDQENNQQLFQDVSEYLGIAKEAREAAPPQIQEEAPKEAEVTVEKQGEWQQQQSTPKLIGLPPTWTPDELHPRQTCRLKKKQVPAAAQILDNIVSHSFTGQLLNAATGTGKTYILGAVLRRLLDMRWKPWADSISPWPIVYVTKASILDQTEWVLKEKFGIDIVNEVQVINIEQLRAKFGDMFIKWETLISQGEESLCSIWKKNIHPILFIWDECHILKNLDSQQSLIAQDVNNIPDRHNTKVFQIFASATAGTRVIEFKCFAVSTHCEIQDKHSFKGKTLLTNSNWSSMAANVAYPQDPTDHSPAAIERLIEILLPFIIDVKGLRPQFHPQNSVEIIDFERPEERQQYEIAWDEYLKKKAEFEASDILTGSQSRMMILAQFTIFRKVAELIRARTLVRRLYRDVQEGSAGVCAVSFKGTISQMVKILVDEYHIPRSQISLIWGGLTPPKKRKKSKTREAQEARAERVDKDKLIHNLILSGASMDEISALVDDLELDVPEVESSDQLTQYHEPHLEQGDIERLSLGPQTKHQRWEEIKKFQSGKSLFCFFTLKAGGVGLSLHHTDEFTTFKCRPHPNGDWVMEEDIPKVPVRPRRVYITPVFSAIELVQGLGRCPRLTSLSNTPQTLIFYRNTIEEKVARSVSIKLKCLKKVVRARESWEDMIINADKLTEDIKSLPAEDWEKPQQLKAPSDEEDGEDDVFIGGEGEDE